MKNGDRFRSDGSTYEVRDFQIIRVRINGQRSYIHRFNLAGLDRPGADKRFEFVSPTEEFERELLGLFGFETIQSLKVVQVSAVKVTVGNTLSCANRLGGKGYSARIVEKGNGLYQVHSASGEIYAVLYDVFTEDARCSCPDFQHHRREKGEICKHILSVVQFTEAQIETNQRIAANKRLAQSAVENRNRAA